MAVAGAGISACTPLHAAPAGQRQDPRGAAAAPASPATAPAAGNGTVPGAMTASPPAAGISTATGSYILQAMPAGTVVIGHGPDGRASAQVAMWGLTPGSVHQVAIDSSTRGGRPLVQFPDLTASAATSTARRAGPGIFAFSFRQHRPFRPPGRRGLSS